MNAAESLTAEWERIDLLGACVSAVRRGIEIPVEMEGRLREVQDQVVSLRQQEPWLTVVNDYGFQEIDQDILACSLAPEADPRLGWMYQELQSGVTSPFPTPALIREMFVLGDKETDLFNQRLTRNSPLIRSGMINLHSADNFYPITPTTRARQKLLGWSIVDEIRIPGAIEVPVLADWNDLVLPEHSLKQIKEYLLWVTHRNIVESEWGARMSGGPVALFAGPSGTGKTLAAEVIASALDWPLYRVDLGLLVSKYIGETEKNLNALFDAAHGKQVVLLFDEADSLFGKRGEIKEARDRYANMEVSHLLSRIERHNGPCIMTSNLQKQIDTAFTRRFQVVVKFLRPDSQARSLLWEKHIPPAAPCEKDLNTNILGKEAKLTGGEIRNAALHAAFLAAGESSPISMKHIASAVLTEFAKKGGELSVSSLGKLSEFLEQTS